MDTLPTTEEIVGFFITGTGRPSNPVRWSKTSASSRRTSRGRIRHPESRRHRGKLDVGGFTGRNPLLQNNFRNGRKS
jgi:hypothetical protein